LYIKKNLKKSKVLLQKWCKYGMIISSLLSLFKREYVETIIESG